MLCRLFRIRIVLSAVLLQQHQPQGDISNICQPHNRLSIYRRVAQHSNALTKSGRKAKEKQSRSRRRRRFRNGLSSHAVGDVLSCCVCFICYICG